MHDGAGLGKVVERFQVGAAMNRRTAKLIREGEYVIEVEVELSDSPEAWGPYLSVGDTWRPDEARAPRRTLTWDAENRLIGVAPLVPADGSQRVSFAYDYLGRRVRKLVETWSESGQEWTVTAERKYVWAGWLLLVEAEPDPSNPPVDRWLRMYTWGLDLAGLNGAAGVFTASPDYLEAAGGVGGLLGVQQRNVGGGQPYGHFGYFYDANGNVTQVMDWATADPNVATVAHYEYDPYGKVVNTTGTYAATNAWRFSTKQFDSETGLGYWGYRYYDPATGRWMSRDPIEEQGGVNLFAYVTNQPVLSVDASGLYLGGPESRAFAREAWERERRNQPPAEETFGQRVDEIIGALPASCFAGFRCCSPDQIKRDMHDAALAGFSVRREAWSNWSCGEAAAITQAAVIRRGCMCVTVEHFYRKTSVISRHQFAVITPFGQSPEACGLVVDNWWAATKAARPKSDWPGGIVVKF